MKNRWKTGFFVLLGIDILIVVFFLFMLLTPTSGDQNESDQQQPAGEFVPFYIQSNKEDLNKLINTYLKNEAANSPLDYKVKLGNEVELDGILPIFNEKIMMKLTFEPEPLDNGDIILRQKSISVGRLQLPVPYVLKLIDDRYNLPEGVAIKPNARQIYVDMQKIKLKGDLKVKINKFDLKNDKIAFTLLVPVK